MGYDRISTDVWAISLPSEWIRQEMPNFGELCYDSPDSSKGVFLNTWRFDDDPRTVHEILQYVHQADVKALQASPDRPWQKMDEQLTEEGDILISTTDYLDPTHDYRITWKRLIALPWLVKASFHDYHCADYAWSVAYFRPIIQSLTLT